jgi:hypothetical protein
MVPGESIAPGDRQSQQEVSDMTSLRRTSTAGLVILSLAATGAPIASASPVGANHPTSEQPASAGVYSRPDKSVIPSGGNVATAATPPPVIRIQVAKGGFDWGDAGIGAAGGLALSMIGLGGVLGAAQYRGRRSRETAALS